MKRYDASEIDLSRIERTPSGGLRIPAHPTRVGVFHYREADGTVRRELRSPEEVFAPESLASLRGAPVTNLHPVIGFVTPDSWKALAVGHVGDEVGADGGFVAADLLIQDAPTIALVEAGSVARLRADTRATL